MAADSVVAHPTTITGSIGVIFLGVNVVGLMEKLGIENQTLTAGAHKDAGSPLRRLSAEERRHLQSVLDELHARFREVVVAGRPALDAAAVAKLADGRIFTAESARELGLIDEVADLEQTLEVARKLLGAPETRVVTYHRPREFANNLYTRAPAPPQLRLEIPGLSAWLRAPGFYYLWAPGLQ
jgi:protease-4